MKPRRKRRGGKKAERRKGRRGEEEVGGRVGREGWAGSTMGARWEHDLSALRASREHARSTLEG